MSSDMAAWIASPYQQPAVFIELTFASSTLYLWTGSGSKSWNGHTWLGAGAMLGFSLIEDASNTEARNLTVTLSGIDTTALPDCLSDIRLGLPVAVYLAGLDGSGAVIADPIAAWAGRMDQPDASVGPDTFTIALNCETRTVDLNTPVDRRYTNEDQQMDWAGDLVFQFVNSIQEMTLFFGGQSNTTNNI